ncbi:aminoglycoside phosphotransferase family protein [Phytomonospora sp. NPDC050363]|uniref:aminoglycoside phosphotransferase family protein n=1 Tax=Phytomonospora sp. NPDC050363 TaxID=3155642 RepID=UPI00340C689C
MPTVTSAPELSKGFAALSAALNLDPHLRRWSAGTAANLLELHAPPAQWSPPAPFEWIDGSRLKDVDLPAGTLGRLREGLRRTWIRSVITWTNSVKGPPDPKDAPWTHAGWHADFQTWIDDSLRLSGVDPQGVAIPVQQWGLSVVFHQRSSRGDYFAKATMPLEPDAATGSSEVRLCQNLALRAPAFLPLITAVRPETGWMLMEDAGGTPLRQCDGSSWESGVRALAALQHRTVGQGLEGCADRRPRELSRRLQEIEDQVRDTPHLSDVERRELLRLMPSFRDVLQSLQDGPVPSSVVHGDFHAGNVRILPDRSVSILDWAYGAVGHPFMDVWTLINRRSPAERDHLRLIYLEQWKDCGPVDKLLDDMLMAQVAGSLSQALTHIMIRRAVGPADRLDFATLPERWCKRALAAWTELDHHHRTRPKCRPGRDSGGLSLASE